MVPSILVFACNWGGLSCVEEASNLGFQYPATVKVVRVRCLSRVHAGLILKPFEFGADGVMLLGCESESCHFGQGDGYISQEFAKAQAILDILGISRNRLVLVRLPAFDGRQFVEKVLDLVEEIKPGRIKTGAKPDFGTKSRPSTS